MQLFGFYELREAARMAGVSEREFIEDALPDATENGVDNELMLVAHGSPSAPLQAAMQRQLEKLSSSHRFH